MWGRYDSLWQLEGCGRPDAWPVSLVVAWDRAARLLLVGRVGLEFYVDKGVGQRSPGSLLSVVQLEWGAVSKEQVYRIVLSCRLCDHLLEAQLLNGIQELTVEQRVAVSVFEPGCFPVEGWEAKSPPMIRWELVVVVAFRSEAAKSLWLSSSLVWGL